MLNSTALDQPTTCESASKCADSGWVMQASVLVFHLNICRQSGKVHAWSVTPCKQLASSMPDVLMCMARRVVLGHNANVFAAAASCSCQRSPSCKQLPHKSRHADAVNHASVLPVQVAGDFGSAGLCVLAPWPAVCVPRLHFPGKAALQRRRTLHPPTGIQRI